MPIGNPNQLVNDARSGSGGTTLGLGFVQHDVPVGDLVVVFAGELGTAGGITSVTDTAGNTYTAGTQINAGVGGPIIRPFYSVLTNALLIASGHTITVNYVSTANSKYAQAVSISGCATSSVLAAEGAGATGIGIGLSVSTGVLPQANCVVLGFNLVYQGSDTNATTGFTAVSHNTGGNTQTDEYVVVAATTSVAYAPTWSSSVGSAANVIAFKGAGAGGGPSPVSTQLMMGV